MEGQELDPQEHQRIEPEYRCPQADSAVPPYPFHHPELLGEQIAVQAGQFLCQAVHVAHLPHQCHSFHRAHPAPEQIPQIERICPQLRAMRIELEHHCQQHFRTGDPGQDPYFPPDIDTGFHSSHLVSPPCFRKNSIYQL